MDVFEVTESVGVDLGKQRVTNHGLFETIELARKFCEMRPDSYERQRGWRARPDGSWMFGDFVVTMRGVIEQIDENAHALHQAARAKAALNGIGPEDRAALIATGYLSPDCVNCLEPMRRSGSAFVCEHCGSTAAMP